jgi:hypothetical protein
MSVLDTQTRVNSVQSFYAPAGSSGGGGGGSTNSFSTINVSTINIQPNGDFNYQGILNFNQGITGAVVFKSTLSVIDGATPATAVVVEAPNNTSQFQLGIGNDNKMFISSSGTSFTWNGSFFNGLAALTASTVTASSINGAVFPAPVSPNQTVSTLIAANSVSTPSILVSSVNGAVFPTPGVVTASSTPLAVALLPFNGSAGSTTALSANIPLLSGGAYRISFNYAATNASNDGGTFILLSGAATAPPLLVIPNIELNVGSPVEGYGACIVRNGTGATINVTLQGYNSSTTAATNLAGSTGWLVEYLGQIAI